MRVPVAALQDFCIQALKQVGLNDADATATAAALVTTDTMGVFTHGTKLLIGYLNRLKGGGYRCAGRPKIEREGPGWAIVDGDSALGQIGSLFALDLAMQKAKTAGIAFVGLRNTGHIGAAGFYAQKAAREGMICQVTGNDMPSVTAPGSRAPVLGSNPFAYGVPVPGQDPILLDIATAAVAGGKVYAAHQRGEPIPPTWIIDRAGRPTTDGSLYPHNAALAPMAGHKGYGIALWVEILSGILPGGAVTWQVGSWIFDEPSKPSLHNASFMVIDVHAMVEPSRYAERMQALVEEIHKAPAAEGVDQVLLPGEREWKLRRTSLDQGIDLPDDVVAKLQQISTEYGISRDWLPKPA